MAGIKTLGVLPLLLPLLIRGEELVLPVLETAVPPPPTVVDGVAHRLRIL